MRPPDAPDAVLLDLDGVLYVEDEPVPGAREAVAALRERGMALRFVTNTTTLPRRRILERLDRLGFAAAPRRARHARSARGAACIDRGHRRVALLMNDAVKEDLAGLEEVEHEADAVIVGDLSTAWAYEPLNRAFRLLMEGAELIALQKNRYWLKPDGPKALAPGHALALEQAEGMRAAEPSRSPRCRRPQGRACAAGAARARPQRRSRIRAYEAAISDSNSSSDTSSAKAPRLSTARIRSICSTRSERLPIQQHELLLHPHRQRRTAPKRWSRTSTGAPGRDMTRA